MELTGKCFEDFLSFFNSKRRGTEVGFYQLPELFQSALIIEFFDSVGFYIEITPHLGGGQPVFYSKYILRYEDFNTFEMSSTFDNGDLFYSTDRNESVNAIVDKANNAYNKLNN